MCPRRTAYFLAFTWLCIASGAAASPVSERLAQVMSVHALEGQFRQQVTDVGGRTVDDASGKVYYSAPNRFRWEYLKPYEQLIVADGATVWMYDKDLEQVTRRPQGTDTRNDPMALLSHPQALDEVYDSSMEAIGQGRQRLLLTAKSEQSPIRRMVIELAGEQLAAVYVLDNFGQRTRFSFSKMVKRKDLPHTLFHFEPPAGVEVVEAMTVPAPDEPVP